MMQRFMISSPGRPALGWNDSRPCPSVASSEGGLTINGSRFTKLRLFCVLFCVCFALIATSICEAATGTTSINLDVSTGIICDNDGVCDSGENNVNCSNDCGCNSNGICESARGETTANCSSDCGCNSNGACESIRGENSSNCVNDCRTSGGGGAITADIVGSNIYNLSIVSSQDSVTISWLTNELAAANIFWGKTSDYEKGSLAKTDYMADHSVLITDLEPSTLYHFKIEVIDEAGNQTISQDQSFRTLSFPDTISPANVSDFNAVPGDKDTELVWKNPLEPDFDEVRILRNDNFYPQDPLDGEIIYQGSDENFLDSNLFDQDYYYTIFSYDKAGNYSSGAIIKAKPKAGATPPIIPPVIPPIKPPITPPEIQKLTLKDIKFIQDDKILNIRDNNVVADAGKPMTISIPYEKFPEVLKTIIVSLERCEEENRESFQPKAGRPRDEIANSESSDKSHPEQSEGPRDSSAAPQNDTEKCKDKSVFSFLLRVNDKKTEYSATILNPQEAGIYPLAISILDFQHQALKEIDGKLLLREQIVPIVESGTVWEVLGRIGVVFAGLVILVGIGYGGWKIIKRRKIYDLRFKN